VQENKNCMVYKWVSIALVFPIEFRDFFAFTLIEILTGHKKKNSKESFSMFIGKFLRKKKKNPWCTSGFPLHLSSLSNFEIFFHSLF